MPARPHGDQDALARLHGRAGLAIHDTTCALRVESERMQLHWIVDGLAEADPRLRARNRPTRADTAEPQPAVPDEPHASRRAWARRTEPAALPAPQAQHGLHVLLGV